MALPKGLAPDFGFLNLQSRDHGLLGGRFLLGRGRQILGLGLAAALGRRGLRGGLPQALGSRTSCRP